MTRPRQRPVTGRWDLVLTASLLSVLPIAVAFTMMRNAFISGLGQLGTGGK